MHSSGIFSACFKMHSLTEPNISSELATDPMLNVGFNFRCSLGQYINSLIHLFKRSTA